MQDSRSEWSDRNADLPPPRPPRRAPRPPFWSMAILWLMLFAMFALTVWVYVGVGRWFWRNG